jgi:hypothetical protein
MEQQEGVFLSVWGIVYVGVDLMAIVEAFGAGRLEGFGRLNLMDCPRGKEWERGHVLCIDTLGK